MAKQKIADWLGNKHQVGAFIAFCLKHKNGDALLWQAAESRWAAPWGDKSEAIRDVFLKDGSPLETSSRRTPSTPRAGGCGGVKSSPRRSKSCWMATSSGASWV